MALDIMIQPNECWLTNNTNGIQVDLDGMVVRVSGFFIKDNVEYSINFDYQVPPPDEDGPDHYLFAISRDNQPVIIVNGADTVERMWVGFAELTVEPGTTDLELEASGFLIRFEPMDEAVIDPNIEIPVTIREEY